MLFNKFEAKMRNFFKIIVYFFLFSSIVSCGGFKKVDAREIDKRRRGATGITGLLSRHLQVSSNLQMEPQMHATGLESEYEGKENEKAN